MTGRMSIGGPQTCITCKHNTYRDIEDCIWVSCGHPLAIEKTPRPAAGDPAWVDLMTSDHRLNHIQDLPNCATWEAIP